MNGKITKVITVLMIITMLATAATSALAAPAFQAEKDIVDIAVEDGRFSTLVTALQAAGLVNTLKSEGPFTVFAPTDDAFAALPAGALDGLLADIPALTDVLLYHVVPGRVMAADVVALDAANTVLGQPVSIKVNGDSVMIDEAQVIITDIEASNGVVHVIDTVLLPPPAGEAMEDPVVSCAEDYIVQADDWLSKIADKFYGDPLAYPAIFEATNAAAAASGAYDAIDDPDFIDIGQTLCIPAVESGQEAAMTSKTIVDIAVEDGRFSTLVTALKAADLVDTLSGDGPFTVFGQSVNITVEGEVVKVDDAQVIITDIEASNGVIHVIDAVLLPQSE